MGKAGVVVYRVLVVVLLAVIAAGQLLHLRSARDKGVWINGGEVEVRSATALHTDGEFYALPLFVTDEDPVLHKQDAEYKRRRRLLKEEGQIP